MRRALPRVLGGGSVASTPMLRETVTYPTPAGSKFPDLSWLVTPDWVAVRIAEVEGATQGGSTQRLDFRRRLAYALLVVLGEVDA